MAEGGIDWFGIFLRKNQHLTAETIWHTDVGFLGWGFRLRYGAVVVGNSVLMGRLMGVVELEFRILVDERGVRGIRCLGLRV